MVFSDLLVDVSQKGAGAGKLYVTEDSHKPEGEVCHVHTILIRIPQWNCQGYVTLDSIYLGSTGANQAVPSNL